jgi:hypothetical protein
MNKKILQGWITGITLLFLLPAFLEAQQSAQTLVTVTPKAKHEMAKRVPQEAVQVSSASRTAEITQWNWAGNSSLQLLVLLDDSTGPGSFGRQLQDIKSFILALPPNTEVSVAYMQNGRAVPTQTFTSDHEAAAKALRLPLGTPGANGSPYFVISDVAKKWPATEPAARREVLMISDGIDRYSGTRLFDPNDPYFQAAIQDAQRAGLIIYSIYYRGAGRLDRSLLETNNGQDYLVGISQATGGRCYLQGLGNPVTISPFLDDLSRRLENQYELGFLSTRNSKDRLTDVKVKIEIPGVEVEAPQKAPTSRQSEGGR